MGDLGHWARAGPCSGDPVHAGASDVLYLGCSVRQMSELGRVLVNLCTLVPAGVVCFLPSYDYADSTIAFLTTSGTMDKISARKQVDVCCHRSPVYDAVLSLSCFPRFACYSLGVSHYRSVVLWCYSLMCQGVVECIALTVPSCSHVILTWRAQVCRSIVRRSNVVA